MAVQVFSKTVLISGTKCIKKLGPRSPDFRAPQDMPEESKCVIFNKRLLFCQFTLNCVVGF